MPVRTFVAPIPRGDVSAGLVAATSQPSGTPGSLAGLC
jgi:hypothetical protein